MNDNLDKSCLILYIPPNSQEISKPMMKTDELRERYLDFFETKGCVRRPSDVLVPRDDPTVLFTPAGMNQFKEQFLGTGKIEFTRATTSQKCLRTGDIENVGVTAFHHTFFEMLGNFSFGDYFKREAIHWAWEFLTDKKWLALEPDRLSVSVYLDDDEAYQIWHQEIQLTESQIRRDDEHENFWPAGAPSLGPDGVCGPCSEIFYHPPGTETEIEIWNLVFTQFNRVGEPPENLQPLPKKNIDTGMGLERTAAVLQKVESNFETDLLKPLCLASGETIGVAYHFEDSNGRALRRIADHARAITFCIHEGVQPGSEKENYVVRQLLRRALLEGYLLGKHEPFLYHLVPHVVQLMGSAYPELKETVDAVSNTIHEEEAQFLGTVEKGLQKFHRIAEKTKAAGHSLISGADAFDLHQTDGFLIELTTAMAAKDQLAIDLEHFQSLMQEHKKGSGSGAFLDAVMSAGPLDTLQQKVSETKFLGYETTSEQGKVVGIIAEKELVEEFQQPGHSQPIALVLEQSPFYAEAGGQVGDTGVLTNDQTLFEVINTQRQGSLILHIGHLKQGTLSVGQNLLAEVDADRRSGIRRAHSATHLLHFALHQIIGKGATQRGSKVEQDTLRFDFAHRQALTAAEIQGIENQINQCISLGSNVTTCLMPLEEAKTLGAMALFGEKYPDQVRVVSMGDYSIELCGGTHLANTGQVGLCKVINEEPVAKGVRRITALTGPKALQKIHEMEQLLKQVGQLLKTPQPQDLPQRITNLQEELKQTKRELSSFTKQSIDQIVTELISAAEEINGVKMVVYAPENSNRDGLRDFIDALKKQAQPITILLGCVENNKVALTAAVSKELTKQGVTAGECIKIAAKIVGGGGGGRPDMAEAGGKNPEKLPEALQAGADYFRNQLNNLSAS